MEKINIAELLKDCPKGMELDCTMFDGVYFDHVDESRHNKIKCYVNNGNEHFEIAFDENGKYISNKSAKCVIFPKGKTTWEGFHRPFKDGDIIITHTGDYTWASIFKQFSGNSCCTYADLCVNDNDLIIAHRLCDIEEIKRQRLATEEEKQKLFDTIKDNGYKWNPETKTLDKLPKFKVGDRIVRKNSVCVPILITNVSDEFYYSNTGSSVGVLSISEQDEYVLVPDEFNITTLVPFESRVLVRNDEQQFWIPAFWGCKRADGYTTTFGWCKYCIPYEGNEHLLENNKDCDEYYKTWK